MRGKSLCWQEIQHNSAFNQISRRGNIMRKALTAIVFAIIMSGYSFAAPQTFTGKITDTMCGKKHMMAGKSDADCVRECMKVKGNWSYGLVVGGKVYRLDGDKDKIAPFAGKQSTVTGEATGDKIAVTSITEAK
jgi:hypothetical protein